MDNIFILAAAGATFSKPLVDLYKLYAPNAPKWLLPCLAIGLGIVCNILIMYASDNILGQRDFAQAILAGMLSGSAAVGMTELQKAAREKAE